MPWNFSRRPCGSIRTISETRRGYAWALYNFNQPAEAAAQFYQAQDLAGDMVDDLIAGLCLCAAAQKHETEAKTDFRRLIALDPAWKDPAHIVHLRGWTARELGELERIRIAAVPAH